MARTPIRSIDPPAFEIEQLSTDELEVYRDWLMDQHSEARANHPGGRRTDTEADERMRTILDTVRVVDDELYARDNKSAPATQAARDGYPDELEDDTPGTTDEYESSAEDPPAYAEKSVAANVGAIIEEVGRDTIEQRVAQYPGASEQLAGDLIDESGVVLTEPRFAVVNELRQYLVSVEMSLQQDNEMPQRYERSTEKAQCSSCGEYVPRTSGGAEWTCPVCGVVNMKSRSTDHESRIYVGSKSEAPVGKTVYRDTTGCFFYRIGPDAPGRTAKSDPFKLPVWLNVMGRRQVIELMQAGRFGEAAEIIVDTFETQANLREYEQFERAAVMGYADGKPPRQVAAEYIRNDMNVGSGGSLAIALRPKLAELAEQIMREADKPETDVENPVDGLSLSVDKQDVVEGLSWGETVTVESVDPEVGEVVLSDDIADSTWREPLDVVEQKLEQVIDGDHGWLYDMIEREYPEVDASAAHEVLHEFDTLVPGPDEDEIEAAEEPLRASIEVLKTAERYPGAAIDRMFAPSDG